MHLIRLIITGFVIAGGFGFILYQILKFTIGINNPASLAKRDAGKLRQALGPYEGTLIPLTTGEQELFSLNKDFVKKRSSMFSLTTGVFNSIYHEPLMAFAFKEYRSKSVSTLLAKTFEDEYFYVSVKGETRVYHNGNALGIILPSGELLSPDKKKLLATISPEDVLTLHPVKVGDREVGKVLNPAMAETVNPRAFQFLEPMSPEENKLFLSLGILSLVEESILAPQA